jgi:hypothetical protein
MIYISQRQFCDSHEVATSRGFDFAITVDGVAFKVRNYLDRPGEFTVDGPEAHRKSPQFLQLVDYLVSVLGGQKMFLYDPRGKVYRELDLETLKFKTHENATIRNHPDAHAYFEADCRSLNNSSALARS